MATTAVIVMYRSAWSAADTVQLLSACRFLKQRIVVIFCHPRNWYCPEYQRLQSELEFRGKAVIMVPATHWSCSDLLRARHVLSTYCNIIPTRVVVVAPILEKINLSYHVNRVFGGKHQVLAYGKQVPGFLKIGIYTGASQLLDQLAYLPVVGRLVLKCHWWWWIRPLNVRTTQPQ